MRDANRCDKDDLDITNSVSVYSWVRIVTEKCISLHLKVSRNCFIKCKKVHRHTNVLRGLATSSSSLSRFPVFPQRETIVVSFFQI